MTHFLGDGRETGRWFYDVMQSDTNDVMLEGFYDVMYVILEEIWDRVHINWLRISTINSMASACVVL